MTKLIALSIVVASVIACKSGNPQQHNDIIAQDNSIKQPLVTRPCAGASHTLQHGIRRML